jgi:UDP-N-acetylmuramyl pentapeptide phosphotransferase/UDP-N-acetylglucosamine-1-phosphate transferase
MIYGRWKASDRRFDTSSWTIVGCGAIVVGSLVLSLVSNATLQIVAEVIVVPIMLVSLVFGFVGIVDDRRARRGRRSAK